MAQKYEAIINYGLENKKSKQEIIAALIKENELNNASTYIKQLDEMGGFGEGEKTQKSQDEAAKANLGTGDLLKQYYTNRNILDKVAEYKNLYTKAVKDNQLLPTESTGVDAAKLKSMYNDIIFQVAQAEGTGALQEADRKIVESMLPDVSTMNPFSIAGQAIRGGKEGNIAAFDTILNSAQERVARLSGQEDIGKALQENKKVVADTLNKAYEYAQANPDDEQSKKFMDDWNNNRIDLNTGKLMDEYRKLTPYEQKLKEQTVGKIGSDGQPGQEEQKEGAIVGFAKDMGERVSNIYSTLKDAEYDKEKSFFGNIVQATVNAPLQAVGQAGGAIGDAFTRATQLFYDVTVPEETKKAIKEKATELFQTEAGQNAIEALEAGSEQWGKFRESYPNVAKDIEAAANILTSIPAGAGLKEGKEIVQDVAGAGIKFAGKDAAVKAGDNIFRAIKPSVTVDRNLSKIKESTVEAINEVFDRGFKPASVREYSEALTQSKRSVWSEIEKSIGDGKNIQIDITPIHSKLVEMAESPVLKRLGEGASSKIQKLADSLISQGDKISVPDAETLKQMLNAELKGTFGKFNLSAAEQNAKKLMNTELGKQLDEVLSGVPGEFQALKNKYGALRQAEEDALKRLVVFERQNPQGLIDSVSKISGVGNIVKGVISLNPADIARGAGELAIGKIQKAANDADNLIKKAFGAVEESKKGFAPRSYLLNKLKDVKAGLSTKDISKVDGKDIPYILQRMDKEDSKVMESFIDSVRLKKPNVDTEIAARRMAEAMGLDPNVSNSKLADKFDQILSYNFSKKGNPAVGQTVELAEEAKKYKSAEEFVNSQNPIYHSTDKNFSKFKNEMGRTWFTDSKNAASSGNIDGLKGKGRVIDRYASNLKLATPDEAEKFTTDELKARGYDGVYYQYSSGKQGNYYEIFDGNKTYTKSQLIDIWKKANKK